ncbi:EVE domain-containing protein [Bacillus sp. UNCCL81]|nr:EVE domain-containing protein [Bacillus sp. UNCCL81]
MDMSNYNKSVAKREYVKGRSKETEFYILTAKFTDNDYKLTLLRNHSKVYENHFEGLTKSKFGAFEWLLNYDSSIFELDKVTMVHYKEDRPNTDSWVKDTKIEMQKNLDSYYKNSKVQNVVRVQEVNKQKDEKQYSKANHDSELMNKNTWIFQGNPKTFDIDNYVSDYRYVWWSLRQKHFLDTIAINDEVFFWRSDGKQRMSGGVLAKGRVVGLPQERANDESAKDYWYTDEWKNPYLAVKLEVLEVKLELGFISRQTLLNHSILKDLLIHKLKTQTNYMLSQEHAKELQKLWASKASDKNYRISINDLESIMDSEIKETEKEQVIKSRIGQSTFKKALLAINTKCVLCGVSDERFLVASHVKPWSQSNHRERLDVNNGLLLCPNHDALFDKGYISFDVDGNILITDNLDAITKMFLNINENIKINLNESQKEYMNWHHKNIFKVPLVNSEI